MTKRKSTWVIAKNNIKSNQEPKSEQPRALENKLSFATNFCN
jgi:hypothetical protein